MVCLASSASILLGYKYGRGESDSISKQSASFGLMLLRMKHPFRLSLPPPPSSPDLLARLARLYACRSHGSAEEVFLGLDRAFCPGALALSYMVCIYIPVLSLELSVTLDSGLPSETRGSYSQWSQGLIYLGPSCG